MSKLTILITRPEPENALSCAHANAHGFNAVPLPMLEITPINEASKVAAIRSQIFNIDEYQYVIFVSKNAARAAAEWLDECWPMLPANTHWIGIGKGTTDTLIAENIPAIANPGHTTEALLDWLKPVKMRNMKVLIVRGEGGRPELAEQLEKRGAQVRYLSLYERRKPIYHAQTFTLLPDIDLIWTTSGENLINLNSYIEQFKPSLKSRLLLTPSERVNTLAINMGWRNAICANGADDASLIAATEFHTGQQNDRD
ncbi:uroporphyrinogen-III synthase [Marinomonas pollencensis]|uniref:Uroporphyrinogen-III synthase n=1 Tax=Marinomonas pollencensis TaxID=491954 RepID=A0A3E0DMK1_9GAMM|nr:uroporphyrinogen-III synthase [Marinomonas pollencensis]REG83020.1 uroporphyrinogen-III synthase [Marinomonas pollencensis]